MTRMRYKRSEGYIINAKPLYNLYNEELKVYIKQLTTEIVNIDRRTSYHISANNLNKLKVLTKQLLKGEGVKFENEIRPKKG